MLWLAPTVEKFRAVEKFRSDSSSGHSSNIP
jgi:hypothetical protein